MAERQSRYPFLQLLAISSDEIFVHFSALVNRASSSRTESRPARGWLFQLNSSTKSVKPLFDLSEDVVHDPNKLLLYFRRYSFPKLIVLNMVRVQLFILYLKTVISVQNLNIQQSGLQLNDERHQSRTNNRNRHQNKR